MPTRPHVRHETPNGTAAGVAGDSEGGRAFLQERLATSAKIGFFFTFVPFVLAEVARLRRLSRASTSDRICLILRWARPSVRR